MITSWVLKEQVWCQDPCAVSFVCEIESYGPIVYNVLFFTSLAWKISDFLTFHSSFLIKIKLKPFLRIPVGRNFKHYCHGASRLRLVFICHCYRSYVRHSIWTCPLEKTASILDNQNLWQATKVLARLKNLPASICASTAWSISATLLGTAFKESKRRVFINMQYYYRRPAGSPTTSSPC